MTLADPTIRILLNEWQHCLRTLTGDNSITISATSTAKNKIDFDLLISIVCRVTGFSFEDLDSKSRQRPRVIARQLIFYYAYKLGLGTLRSIGERLGSREYTTVIHSRETIESLIHVKDDNILTLIRLIESEIQKHETRPS